MIKKRITDPNMRALCQKIHKKLREFEKDEMQIHCMVVGAYQANDKPVETLNKLYDYLCDPNTIKTRHAINEFVLEMDTEFIERCKTVELMEKADKITF